MTVSFADAGAMVICDWFVGPQKQSQPFNEEMLVPHTAPTPVEPVKMKFAVGDKVKLRAGGPEMVIEHLQGPGATAGWVNASYFEGAPPKAVLKRARFHQDTLEAIAVESPAAE